MREEVMKGDCSGDFSLSLDPGTYRIKIIGPIREGEFPEVMWVKDLIVGSPDDIKRVKNRQPRWARSAQTSQGARWRCMFPGCGYNATSPTGAWWHEMEDHFNLDPAKATQGEIEKARKKAPVVAAR